MKLARFAAVALVVGVVAGLPGSRRGAATVEPVTLGLANISMVHMADSGTGPAKRTLYGPVLNVNFPDPSILNANGRWYAYATQSNGKFIPVATSSSPTTGWSLTNIDALPNPGPWVRSSAPDIWAPDVIRNDAGTYVMYYSARGHDGFHCIGVATSSSPTGPFAPRSTPFICDRAGGGAIDASGYDDGNNRWVLWKVDGGVLGGATTCQPGQPRGSYYYPSPIKIQRVTRDGQTLQGGARTILDNFGAANDGIVEAPALHRIGPDSWVLFYSAHCFSSDDYDIEYAFSSTIDGAYEQRGLLLLTAFAKGIYGPGGLDIDPNGRNVLFHGRLGPNQGGDAKRAMYSATLTINGRSVTGADW